MPRATCRCGQVLSIPVNGPDRVICPTCQAKIRVRKDSPVATATATATAAPADGEVEFLRFECPCGRRLKVRKTAGLEVPQAGKCPDCGRIVPVPVQSTASSSAMARSPGDPESRTEELDDNDITALDRWTETHNARRQPASPSPARKTAEVTAPSKAEPAPAVTETMPLPTAAMKVEAGLRVCPRCGRPVHLSSVVCRECGAHVPKR